MTACPLKYNSQMIPLTKNQFSAKIKDLGRNYHIHHPYNKMLHEGKATEKQVKLWVANRFYYQISIPIKDALFLSNCNDIDVRRNWIQRILDHDSVGGGIDSWLLLGKACGLTENDLLSLKYVLPGVKFAVDAYINFVRHSTWQEAACSSLTELFAPKIHQTRLDTWPTHYKWIDEDGFKYFQQRLSEARRDVEFGLDATLEYFNTPELQKKAIEIVQFKLDVLWSISDAMYMAYVLNMPPYYCCEKEALNQENKL